MSAENYLGLAMTAAKAILTRATFQFFRDLSRHNKKEWMDANRERYKSELVQPLRRLLEELAPAMLEMEPGFDTSGRTGANFSRINRDIRFAKDKTPYKKHMYLKFSVPAGAKRETGQLYVGLSVDTVTSGFRIYAGPKRKESVIAMIAEPRINANPKWAAQQKRRLAGRYESYWYSMVKGEWTKRAGWPSTPEEWEKLQGWVVRRKLSQPAATRESFPRDLEIIFRDLYPLLKFTSLT